MEFSIIELILTVVIIVFIYKYFENQAYGVVWIKSATNGKEYKVRDLPDKQAAANLLGTIANKLQQVVDILSAGSGNLPDTFDKYVRPDIKGLGSDSENSKYRVKKLTEKLGRDIARLKGNFNPETFNETTPDSAHTSYSVNKGEKIFFCLRDKGEQEKLVKENTMMFVSLHELAHLMTESIGHEPEFWDNFKIILRVAIANGLYKHIDFNSSPQEYCGTTITDTPLKLNE
jgi:hypothetical protein